MRPDTAATKGARQAAEAAPAVKYIKFRIAEELFGIDILKVQEILFPDDLSPAPLPSAPPFLLGVVNLRGTIVPLVNLRRLLGMPDGEQGDRARVLMVRPRERRVVGIVVDGLDNVVEIGEERIEPLRTETTIVQPRHVRGVYKEEHSLTVLLDIGSILYPDGVEEPEAGAGA